MTVCGPRELRCQCPLWTYVPREDFLIEDTLLKFLPPSNNAKLMTKAFVYDLLGHIPHTN